MIVYQASKTQYLTDVESNRIHFIIEDNYIQKTGGSVGKSELMSWKNSNDYMYRVMIDQGIPQEVQIVIEFKIGMSKRRIDFLIAGRNELGAEHVVLIELKQWSTATLTKKDGIVNTLLGGGLRDTTHPSYQIWSYTVMLEGFNSVVYNNGIQLHPCAYLHNYVPNGVLTHESHAEYTQKAPVFLQQDSSKLKEYIKTYITVGDLDDTLGRIDRSEFRPSKKLAESVLSMLEGNQEFVLIDEQKLAYEEILLILSEAEESEKKKVVIIQGEPGTGKSVIAINLLVEAIGRRKVAKYVTKTLAPRDVYGHYLKSKKTGVEIKALMSGSASFTTSKEDEYDLLLVDEAHRLMMKNRYNADSYNQAIEIMKASKTSVFFVDDRQVVDIKDVGTTANLRRWAEQEGFEVVEYSLTSQFRCSGSDDYLQWLDSVLEIDSFSPYQMQGESYEFKVFDSAKQMQELIVSKNTEDTTARIVAGYCYPWSSKKNTSLKDIYLDDDFAMRWNDFSKTYIVNEESIDEVGSIHTVQGMEVDYVGVIIGKDMQYKDGQVVTDFLERDSNDRTIFGFKKLMKEDPQQAYAHADQIIKNTYRVLMTRGMKGCYVYCEDEGLREYIRELV